MAPGKDHARCQTNLGKSTNNNAQEALAKKTPTNKTRGSQKVREPKKNPERGSGGVVKKKSGTAAIDPAVAKAMMAFIDRTVEAGIEGLKKEFERIGPPKTLTSTAFKNNTLKNRYGNVPCFDATRVVLEYEVPPQSDYIHANHVQSKYVHLPTTFICTQAPTERTINDFWRMLLQPKPKLIVMLCRLVANKQPKCAPYWPDKLGETATYGSITVTNEGDGGKDNEKVFDIEKFRVQAANSETPIEVKHIRWLDWPDFGIPHTGMGMLRVLRKIDLIKGTAVVHCAAGIGRTGTIVAAEIIMRMLQDGKMVKPTEVIHNLREQRFGLIQTSSQYIYLHFSICTYCERKLEAFPEAAPQLKRFKNFVKAYKEFANNEEAADRKLAAEGFATRQSTNVC